MILLALLNRSYQDRQALELQVNNLRSVASDVLWELCRKGILRPQGENYLACCVMCGTAIESILLSAAYVAMLTLLRFSEFMCDHWDEIVNKK
jgi:hypothetical protein